MSFRHATYLDLLRCFKEAGRIPITVAGYIQNTDIEKYSRYVILRHDVDRMTSRSVAMAEMEAENGVRSTYYFRCSKDGVFPKQAIRAIFGMGHEVGYHYECLSACGGDRSAALKGFEENLTTLRSIASCNTVSMHGAPLSRFSNQDLLIGVDLANHGLVADASLAFAHSQVAYFTDTGGTWNGGAGENFRDRVGLASGIYPTPASSEFSDWLNSYDNLVYVSTHPERWASTSIQFGVFLAKDRATALAKKAIYRYRRVLTHAH